MICPRDVHVLSTDGQYDDLIAAATDQRDDDKFLSSSVRRAIGRARQLLLSQQQSDGHWSGHVEGDAACETRYVLLLAYLGQAQSEPALRAARRVIEKQRSDGGWSAIAGGPVDASNSTLAYFALKLTGHDPADDCLRHARAAIMAAGGADAVGIEARYLLALLGQIPYQVCPQIPPAAAMSGDRLGADRGAMDETPRDIVTPLAVVSACRPKVAIDPRHGIRELFIKHPRDWPSLPLCAPAMWRRGALGVLARAANRIGKRGWAISPRSEIAAARDRLLSETADRRQRDARFQNLLWNMIAWRCLDHGDDMGQFAACRARLGELIRDAGNTLQIQPFLAPVIDTAIALQAVLHGGAKSDHPGVPDAVSWLLNRPLPADDSPNMAATLLAVSETTATAGDGLLPPGLRLFSASEGATARNHAADLRALTAQQCESRLIAAQNRDGGWSAAGSHDERPPSMPGAKHGLSRPDVTALVLQALGQVGRRIGDKAIDRAAAYLRDSQAADGSWTIRPGVRDVVVTARVIAGLRAVGVAADAPLISAGLNWLRAEQLPCGGWRQSPFMPVPLPTSEPARESAVATAAAVLALVAVGLADLPATVRGVRYLQESQQRDGSWQSFPPAADDFACHDLRRYNLPAIGLPLSALARWAVARGETTDAHVAANRSAVLAELLPT